MKKKLLVGLMAVVLACTAVACGDKKGESGSNSEEKEVTAERGTIEGNEYKNESIGLKATFPEGSTILTDEEIKDMLGESEEGMMYDAMMSVGAGEGNAQITIEDTKTTTGKAVTEDEYVKNLEDNLESMYKTQGLTVDDISSGEKSYGGVDFKTVTVGVSGMTQVYHLHQEGKYMVEIITTYTETSKDTIQQFMDSVKAM